MTSEPGRPPFSRRDPPVQGHDAPGPGTVSPPAASDFTAALAANAASRQRTTGATDAPVLNGASSNGGGGAGWTPREAAPFGQEAAPFGQEAAEPVVDLRDHAMAAGERWEPAQPVDPWDPVGPQPWNPVDTRDAPATGDPAAGTPHPGPEPDGTWSSTSTPPFHDAATDAVVARPPAGAGPQPATAPARAPWPSPDRDRGGASSVAPPGTLAGRIVRNLLLPPLAVVLLAALLAAVLVLRGNSLDDRAAEAAEAAASQHGVATAVDRLWTGVLGLVATGIGQEVVTPPEVQAMVGEARAAAGDTVSTPSGISVDAATAARTAFVDAVDAALTSAQGDPLELGNALGDLADLHRTAAEGTQGVLDDLDAEADGARRSSSRWDLAAFGALLLGAALAAIGYVLARRRLVDAVDLPVARVRDAVQRFRSGDPAVRSRAGGMPELAGLGSELDAALLELDDRVEGLRRRAEWGEQSRMIFDALDLADDEDALFEVVTRALGIIAPGRPVELLMAERAPSRLTVVASNPFVEPPADPVDTHGVCVALRRGQVSVFDSSSSINSCPMLRARAGGPVSGVCVPVTVAARPVGVLHMTGPEFQPPDPHTVDRLVSLASQIGNRLGSLRTLESTRHEASTDGLTGLPNRRSLEADVAELIDRGTPFVMVLADLDKFKRLNDNYGHEVGDKALQLFAGVLRDNVRGNDVVARLGGEEFVLVYPNMSVEISIEAIGRLRAALARTIASSPIPPFTCSFGVTHSSVGIDGDSILRIADAGLLRAKALGGDQAVFADAELAAEVFAESEAAERARRRDAGDDRR